MNKLLGFLLLLLIGPLYSNAQLTRYIVQFKDKSGSPFTLSNPSQFLSQRAINRRTKYTIALDQTDLPVVQAYIDSIRLAGNVTILNVSKWFNQVAIKTTDASALARINAMPFVMASTAIASRSAAPIQPVNKLPDTASSANLPALSRPQIPNNLYDYGLSYPQVHLHNAEFLHNHGFRGEGMQLAMMDAGFYHYSSLPTFDSIRANNQVLGTWDFVANKESVDEEHPHGMDCLSTIAANMPGTFVGTAPKCTFYLFRTEDVASEYPVEEHNFAVAAEKADSLGVDLFSVSLGYNYFDNAAFNYSYANMNGQTSMIARASDLAAQKGIAVVVAAGNDGDKAWHYITTPGDADSVITVGAVTPNRNIALFSGFGPSSDGQIKPDVAAVGGGAVVASATTGLPVYGNGTSYACPIMAGITACLWQAFPEVNNMAIAAALRKSADRYSSPDDRTGYGIPDVKKAFIGLIKQLSTSQFGLNDNCEAVINWTAKVDGSIKCILERKLAIDPTFVAIDTQQVNGSFSKQNFTYIDPLISLAIGSTVRYRIKMQIAGDSSFYLDSASLNYTPSCNAIDEKITVGPNPVKDNLAVTIVRDAQVKAAVVLYATSGQQVFASGSQVINGAGVINIPMAQMSRGLYYVAVFINDKKVLTKKIVRN